MQIARVVLLAILFPPLTGCAASGSKDRCLPSPLHLSSPRAGADASVDLNSGPFQCNAQYPADKRYELMLVTRPGRQAVPLGQYPVAPDGTFRAVVHIPRTVRPGAATIVVRGSTFDADCKGHRQLRVLRGRSHDIAGHVMMRSMGPNGAHVA
jgi:hypothetical protein